MLTACLSGEGEIVIGTDENAPVGMRDTPEGNADPLTRWPADPGTRWPGE